MTSTLHDEMISINAIYGPDTLLACEDVYDACVLTVAKLGIRLRLAFPANYSDSPPMISWSETTTSALSSYNTSRVVNMARDVLKRTFSPGVPCVYDLLEELDRMLEDHVSPGAVDEKVDLGADQRIVTSEPRPTQSQPVHIPAWTLSSVLTEKRSTFLGRATHLASPDEVVPCVHHLVSTDKKVAKATHNITAWRVQEDPMSDAILQDCDDDGESAAGGRLLHLLQVMDVRNVLVVVSRWYGGVQLGADRFRIINAVARDALVKGEFARAGEVRRQAADRHHW